MIRINKYLADSGVCSRRAAEQIICAGRVKVDGKVVTELGAKIGSGAVVTVDGKKIECQSEKVYILLYKPKGVVTTCSDQFGRRTVIDVIEGHRGPRVYPVGRLDYDTEGLLILTNDGEFARRVTHPAFGVVKVYVATLDRSIEKQQVERLSHGVKIDVSGKFYKVSGRVRSVSKDGRVVDIEVSEGRNRQVRKMFEAVGLRVVHLVRTAIGELSLGAMKSGQWRYIRKPKL